MNQEALYHLVAHYLHRERQELRATFTRDWFLWGRSEAVMRIATRRMWEVADYRE